MSAASIKASAAAKRNSSTKGSSPVSTGVNISSPKTNISGGGSTQQQGLNQKQISQLKGLSGINQSALSAYEASGSAVGGRNNPTGTGRTVINSSTIKETTPMPLSAPTTNTVADAAAPNAGMISGDSSLTYDGGKFSQSPVPDARDVNQSVLQNKLTEMQNQRVTGASIQSKLEKESNIKQLRQQEANYAGQINTIMAERDANILRVEGQGRGIPEAIIGGQQAQINKEAAIKALPVQALLANAQGNVALAEAHINTWGAILMQDANNTYKDKKELLTNAYDYAQGREKERIDELKAANERKYQETQAFVKTKTAAMAQALSQPGGSAVIPAIQSATTAEEVAMALGKYSGDVLGTQIKQKQLADLYAPKGEGKSPWQMMEVNGVTSWVNEDTQEIKPAGGVDGSNLKPVKDAEIRDLNDTWTATNSIVSIIDQMTEGIKNEGTKVFWGEKAGKRGANKTNLLLAMKNLEKTGALDKGTIDVLADLIPENEFFATEARQIASLNQLKDTVSKKTGEFVGSYQGTTAEIDPRTKRIYGTPDISSLPENDVSEVYDLFGVNKSKGSTTFSADEWLK